MVSKSAVSKPDRLKSIEDRLSRLEILMDNSKRIEAKETAVSPWSHLVRRQHPWRKQLYVKGRNLTARQLVGAIQANAWTAKAAATNYRLPIAAIREAQAYVEEANELLQAEAEIERLMLQREGARHAAQSVS